MSNLIHTADAGPVVLQKGDGLLKGLHPLVHAELEERSCWVSLVHASGESWAQPLQIRLIYQHCFVGLADLGIEPVLDALAPFSSPFGSSLSFGALLFGLFASGILNCPALLFCFCFRGSSLSVLLFVFVVLLGLVPGLSGRRLVQDFQHRPFPSFSLVRLSAWLGNCQLGSSLLSIISPAKTPVWYFWP